MGFAAGHGLTAFRALRRRLLLGAFFDAQRGEFFAEAAFFLEGIALGFHLAVPGISSFDAAESAAVEMPLENGTPCRVLSAGRSQDQLDAEFLREKRRE